MDDKIFNINDYKKNKEKKEVNNPPKPPEEIDAGDISIEDPFIFLNAEERKQYMLEHQHDIADDSVVDVENNGSENAADEQMPEDDSEACDSDDRNDDYDREECDSDDRDDDYDHEERDDDRDDDYDREECDDDRDDRGFLKRKRSALFHKTDDMDMEPDDYGDDSGSDEDEDINQGSDDYNDESCEGEASYNGHKDRIIRIASTLTGILIIAVVALIVKIRFVDPILSAGEGTDTGVASASTAVSGESVVTTHDLNLRTSEDSSSKDNIAATVSEGTVLIRISEDNGWSEVSYNGQTLYCATKYLNVQ